MERISTPVYTHILKARTFLKPVPGKFYVNHINGIKIDNDEQNLEWVTSSENLIHAYVTGLRSDNHPVNTFDTLSGELVEHYSLNEASRYLEVNPEKLHRYLKSEKSAKFLGRYLVFQIYDTLEVAKKKNYYYLSERHRKVSYCGKRQ